MTEMETKKKVLVVDDDEAIVRLVDMVLSREGYEVLKAANGRQALRIVFDHRPDVVLLDVVMPKMDGWQTCSYIRDVSDMPIIILSGESKTEADIVRGLDHGADDYMLKPVNNKELVARVRAALRRAELPSIRDAGRVHTYADDYLSVDINERKVMVNGERVRLTPIEFRLFAYLVKNAGRVLTHKQLLEKVWGWEYTDDVDYVRIYISHLRQKIERAPALPEYILTDPGVGYYFQRAQSK